MTALSVSRLSAVLPSLPIEELLRGTAAAPAGLQQSLGDSLDDVIRALARLRARVAMLEESGCAQGGDVNSQAAR